MDSYEDERDLGEKIDQFLSEELDDYEPPSEEEIEECLEKAPDPSEAVPYEPTEGDGEANSLEWAFPHFCILLSSTAPA